MRSATNTKLSAVFLKQALTAKGVQRKWGDESTGRKKKEEAVFRLNFICMKKKIRGVILIFSTLRSKFESLNRLFFSIGSPVRCVC